MDYFFDLFKKSLEKLPETHEGIEQFLWETQCFLYTLQIKAESKDEKMQHAAREELKELLSALEKRFGPIDSLSV